MDTTDLLFTITSIAFILISAYGAFNQNRKSFLIGMCLWSIIPVVGEGMAYANDSDLAHLGLMALFFCLVILTFPTNNAYNSQNIAATALAKKIGLALLVANIFQGFNIICNDIGVDPKFGYFHLVAALIILYPIIRTNMDKNFSWK